MDIGKMVGDSFEYTKSGLWGNWVKWISLFICQVIFPLWGGYQWKIYRGESTIPSLEHWGEMFINGIKLIIVNIVYFLIPIIVFLVSGGLAIIGLAFTKANNPASIIPFIASLGIAIIISIVVFFIFALLALMANIRFARTDNFGEAFNFNAIMGHIGKIGWGSYIVALIVMFLILFVVAFAIIFIMAIIGILLALIPYIGPILMILLFLIVGILIGPFFGCWMARYITLIFDSAGTA
ncbi:MAG: DUF4013 domain-containing protein [Methanomicrobiales archaeon]|nr:DUF4013 domain-containing protein [Methanomicrobiales archaeon]